VNFLVFLFFGLCFSSAFAVDFNELLWQYSPRLFTTDKEFSPPIAVEDMLSQSYIIDNETKTAVRDESGQLVVPTLENLYSYDDERYNIKLKVTYTRMFGDSNRENYNNARPVVYARAVEVPEEELIALQYFFFYAGSHTGRMLLPIQLKWHEGDTEYAQVILNSKTLKPIGASSSIHYYGESVFWEDVIKSADGRPHMYVAKHSHATYFTPSGWRGHQAMTGNLGFGGQYMLSVATVWDVTAEDREVNYELRIPMENHPVFTWKGRWGGKDRIAPEDDSARTFDLGPQSFAYRDAMSEKLSMWANPAGFFYFYLHPSAMYQKFLLSLREIKDKDVMEEIIALVTLVGRLRTRVEYYLHFAESELELEKQAILAEAVPFVVFSQSQGLVDRIWGSGKDKIGSREFADIVSKLSKKKMQMLLNAIRNQGLHLEYNLQNPLDLYRIPAGDLIEILRTLTGLEAEKIQEIYWSSWTGWGERNPRISDALY
jgi:hypothetical protein